MIKEINFPQILSILLLLNICLFGYTYHIALYNKLLSENDFLLIHFLKNIYSIIGLLFPVITIMYYFFTIKFASIFFDIEISGKIIHYLISFYLPYFLFLLINLYFIDKITVEALITINETGKGAIIPNISIQNSKVISSTLNILPLAGAYLYIENENKNINFYSKVFIVFFPVVIILIYQLIKKIIFL